jgi:hypothetical protein
LEPEGKTVAKAKDMRIWRSLERIKWDKRQLIQLLDTFTENNHLKQQAVGG